MVSFPKESCTRLYRTHGTDSRFLYTTCHNIKYLDSPVSSCEHPPGVASADSLGRMSCRTCHTEPPAAACGSCWCADSGWWTSSYKSGTRAVIGGFLKVGIEHLRLVLTLRPSCTSLMCCLRSEYLLPHTGQAVLCFWWTCSMEDWIMFMDEHWLWYIYIVLERGSKIVLNRLDQIMIEVL